MARVSLRQTRHHCTRDALLPPSLEKLLCPLSLRVCDWPCWGHRCTWSKNRYLPPLPSTPMPLGVFHPDLWWGIDHRFRKDGNGWSPNVILIRTPMNCYEDLKLVPKLETSQWIVWCYTSAGRLYTNRKDLDQLSKWLTYFIVCVYKCVHLAIIYPFTYLPIFTSLYTFKAIFLEALDVKHSEAWCLKYCHNVNVLMPVTKMETWYWLDFGLCKFV